MTLVMPLGVLANQLVKIEGDLRFLSMKAAEHPHEDIPRSTRSLDARLELIHGVLASIDSLLAKLQADVHPKEAATQFDTRDAATVSTYKPSPELDD